MCSPNDNSHVEAWKSLIDLSKMTMSIASTVLTALIGFYVLNQYKFDSSNYNYLAPILLVLSILSAIYGVGRSVRVIKTGISETLGVIFTNIAVIFLVAGILSIALIKFNKTDSLDVVLANIEKETITLKNKFSPKLVKKVEIINLNYLITYEIDTKTVKVIYSQEKNKIIQIE